MDTPQEPAQEDDPADVDPATGAIAKEELWVDYYVTTGSVGGPALLYDAHAGKMPNTSVNLDPPATAPSPDAGSPPPQWLSAIVTTTAAA